MDSDSFSTLISPSPSISTSSWTSILSAKKDDDDLLLMDEQEEYNKHRSKTSLPPSPTLTAYDHRTSTTDTTTLVPLDATTYFANRPLPTQRRQPGRNRHSAIESGPSTLYDVAEPERHSLVLEKLAYDTLTYFVDAPSPSASSPLLKSSPCQQASKECPPSELVERLTSRLTASSSVHPSVLKLAQDVLSFMNETPPLAPECQRLKPKLEVCVLIHGQD
jgi:hypothetical protein